MSSRAEDGDQLVDDAVARPRRGEGDVGSGVELLFEDEDHEISLVLGIVEESAEADVGALGDLAHRRRAIAVPREELARRGGDAIPRLPLLPLPQSAMADLFPLYRMPHAAPNVPRVRGGLGKGPVDREGC